MSNVRGLFRSRGANGPPHNVRVGVGDGRDVWEIPESEYLAMGYRPHINHLPWKEMYEAAAMKEAIQKKGGVS